MNARTPQDYALEHAEYLAAAPSQDAEDRSSLAHTLRTIGKQAYRNYVEQMRRDECLGCEQKVKTGSFTSAELKGHIKAGEQLGRFRAFYEAANALMGSKAALVSSTQPKEVAPAQDADDTVRLDWLIEQRAYVVSDPDACPGYWIHWKRDDGSTWVQAKEYASPRLAIDAARKQEGCHDHEN